MKYYKRIIDDKLSEWKNSPHRKPLLIRGARQVGKSTAIKELGKQFRYFVEINLEKQPDLQLLFTENIDVKKTCEKLSGTLAMPIVPGETLLFIDEPLTEAAHKELIDQLRSFYLVGGMPAAVAEWVESRSYIEVSRIHNDIIDTYSDDFSKYKDRYRSPITGNTDPKK